MGKVADAEGEAGGAFSGRNEDESGGFGETGGGLVSGKACVGVE